MANQSVNIRQAFTARPGYYFVDPDYSQIEFRLSAAIAGERRILQGYLRGDDYYKMTYAAMAGDPNLTADQVTAPQRQIGKVLALGQSYDQGPGGLARKLGCTFDQAKQYMDAYWAGMDATRRAKDEAVRHAIATGGVTTWFGFKRPLPDLYAPDRRTQGKGRRSVWSTKIQGTAAGWMKIAMLRAHRAIRQLKMDVHLLMTIHDELLFEASEREPFHKVCEVIRQAMEFKVKGLPVNNQDLYPDGYWVPINFEFGYNWGETMELDDVVKKDKKTGETYTIEGFKSYCIRTNKPVNFTEVRPEDIQVNFLAAPAPVQQIYIAPRKRLKAEPGIATGGMDPIDAICAIVEGKELDDRPPASESTPQLPGNRFQQPEPEKSAFASAVESTPAPHPSLTKPVFEEKAEALRMALNATEQLPTDDFVYPTVVVEISGDLTEKEVNFVKALATKLTGEYWLHLVYQGKTLRAGAEFKVDPSEAFLGYVKKALGDRSKVTVYDETGKEASKRVAFA